MQSVQLEREVGNVDLAQDILTSAIEKYPNYYKLHLIAATLKSDVGDYDTAREIYENAVKVCKNNSHLWA
jgi:pre-mRNA-processing factor 6